MGSKHCIGLDASAILWNFKRHYGSYGQALATEEIKGTDLETSTSREARQKYLIISFCSSVPLYGLQLTDQLISPSASKTEFGSTSAAAPPVYKSLNMFNFINCIE